MRLWPKGFAPWIIHVEFYRSYCNLRMDSNLNPFLIKSERRILFFFLLLSGKFAKVLFEPGDALYVMRATYSADIFIFVGYYENIFLKMRRPVEYDTIVSSKKPESTLFPQNPSKNKEKSEFALLGLIKLTKNG